MKELEINIKDKTEISVKQKKASRKTTSRRYCSA